MPILETASNVSLYYNDWGTGAPVVLIHGWPLSSAMWEYQTNFLLQNDVRCISYDRRGFGRSGQPWTGYDYDTLAGDLAALLDHLDVKQATLVGFSMGGGEVVRYLSRHNTRGRVSKAVLVSSVVPLPMKTSDNPQGVDPRVFEEMVKNLSEDRPHFLAGFAKLFYGVGVLSKPVSSEILDWNQQLALQASPKATIDCVRVFSATDFRSELNSIRVPTLVIHGDADATVPIDPTGKAAARLIPNAELKVYDGAPHGLFITEKDRLNRDLLAFIRR